MSAKSKHSAQLREEALRFAISETEGELGWLDVLKLGLQYARRSETGQLPNHKDMAIAIDCAKELEKIGMPRLSTKPVDENKKEKRTMLVSNVEQYLPDDTEEL